MSMKKGTLLHDALVLFAITLIAAIALGFVFEITKDPIASAQAKAKVEAYKAVFPEMADTAVSAWSIDKAGSMIAADPAYEGVTVDEILCAVDASGKHLGHVMTLTSSKGYGGAITMAVGIAEDGTLKGVEFLKISETAGLGMKAKNDDFKSQFAGAKVGQFSLAKRNISGDTPIDAISSATITTTAVTRTVNAALSISSKNYSEGGAY